MKQDTFLTYDRARTGQFRVWRGRHQTGDRPIRTFPTEDQAKTFIRTAHHQRAFTSASGKRVPLRSA